MHETLLFDRYPVGSVEPEQVATKEWRNELQGVGIFSLVSRLPMQLLLLLQFPVILLRPLFLKLLGKY